MIHFNNLEILLVLWAIPFLVAMFIFAGYKRKQALRLFADSDLLQQLNVSVSITKRRWKAIILITAFALIVVAAARPAWNPLPKKIQRYGRDVVFVLDVSKSMLAQDLAPNRLERSKLAIVDCIEKLEGDRVGLVVFAGTATIKCPLTLDYGFFRLMLEDVSVDSVSRGGTMIGDALRKTLDEVFDDIEKQFKDIILITDGEDHDSFPVEAASELAERGIRIIAIGIGDEDQGERIPITDESGRKTFRQYNGQEVWSKLDAKTLRKMVKVTPGSRYLNVSTGAIDLGDVYLKLVASREKKELGSETIQRYEEKFQIFVALALILLCAELLISERKRGL